MSAKYYEFIHVSQLLETIFGLSVVLLPIAQFLMTRHELWADIATEREQENLSYERWRQEEAIRRGVTIDQQHLNKEDDSMAADLKEGLDPAITNRTEPQPIVIKEDTVIKEDISIDNEESKDGQEMEHTVGPAAPQPFRVETVEKTQPKKQEVQNDPYSHYSSSKRQAMGIYAGVNEIFDYNIPVIMCCMILAMLVEGTFILSAVCFFCYLFFNLVFNYANLVEKLEMKMESRILPTVLQLMGSCFIIVFFVGLLIRKEFL